MKILRFAVFILAVFSPALSIVNTRTVAQEKSTPFSPEYPSEATYDAVLFPNVNVQQTLDPTVGEFTYLFLGDAGDTIDVKLSKLESKFDPLLQIKNFAGDIMKEGYTDIFGEGASIEGYTLQEGGWYYLFITYDPATSTEHGGDFSLRLTGSTASIYEFIIPVPPPSLNEDTVLLGSDVKLSEITAPAKYLVPLKPAASLDLNYDSAQVEVTITDILGVPLSQNQTVMVEQPQWVILNIVPIAAAVDVSLTNRSMEDRGDINSISLASLVTSTPAPTDTPSLTPSNTATATLTLTPSLTPTHTLTYTPSMTPRISPTPTRTLTPSITPTDTPTNTLTPSQTPTNTRTPRASATPIITPIDLGDSVTKTTSETNAVKYSFRGKTGDVITITLKSTSFDAYLTLTYNERIIAEDDDSAGGTDAMIENFELPNNGTYNITVGSFDGVRFSGKYTLSLEEGESGPPPLVHCPGTLQSRLYRRDIAQVSPDGGANRIRRGIGTNFAQVGTMPAGAIFTVIDGPQCADGYAWYQVNYEGTIGWTAEGDNRNYWLERVVENEPGIVAVLLDNGRGLTDRRIVNYGNFQVEGYCQRQGYKTSNDNRDWYCTRGGNIVETLSNATFDEICRETYNRQDAYALQIGRGIRRAYRWRCLANEPAR